MCVSFDVYQNTVVNLRRKTIVKAGGLSRFSSDGAPTEGWSGTVPLGGAVLFELPDEKDFPHQGKLDSTDARLDPATSTAHWRALFPNADGLLMPGMYVRVRMATSAPHKALLIPETALISDQGQKYVFVVSSKGVGHEKKAGELIFTNREDLELLGIVIERECVAERRLVKIGRGQREGGLSVVEEGLTADDRVVVSDVRGLRPGMSVKLEELPPSPAPPQAKPK
jgi:multidrug efflux pump subunit AcrA (membrane-fusion protein)